MTAGTIDRGYERIEEKLRAVGADINRVCEKRARLFGILALGRGGRALAPRSFYFCFFG